MADSKHVVVIGSGPGGYSAAYRAADLGLKVTLIERYENIGGVCLNVGCIPSKALLHMAELIYEAKEVKDHGLDFGEVKIDIDKVRAWKDKVIGQLTQGLSALGKARKVNIVTGNCQFVDAHHVEVTDAAGKSEKIHFDHAIIAAGSRPIMLPFLPEDPRIFDSTGALELEHVGGKMLVIGGGIIGCELGSVYQALGSEVDIVEMTDQIIPPADADLVRPLVATMKERGVNIKTQTKVVSAQASKKGIEVTLEDQQGQTSTELYQAILVSVGRKSNADLIGVDKLNIQLGEGGFIPVNNKMQTELSHISAVGDIAGNPMLAHKAVPEGRLAAEVIAGKKHIFDAICIPNVAYTDPEIAWVGLSEKEAKEKGIEYSVGSIPWMACGRALSMGRGNGMTKILFDPNNDRVLGAGIVGKVAGDLIAEIGLAIEMGCVAEDIALTIHAHPTLAETNMLAAEMYLGNCTDYYVPPNKRPYRKLAEKES